MLIRRFRRRARRWLIYAAMQDKITIDDNCEIKEEDEEDVDTLLLVSSVSRKKVSDL